MLNRVRSLRALALGALALTVSTMIGCRSETGPAAEAAALSVHTLGSKTPLTIVVGAQTSLVAQPVASDSSEIGAPISAMWTSSDTTRLMVDATGLVTPKRSGTVTVIARATLAGRSLTGQTQVTVVTANGG